MGDPMGDPIYCTLRNSPEIKINFRLLIKQLFNDGRLVDSFGFSFGRFSINHKEEFPRCNFQLSIRKLVDYKLVTTTMLAFYRAPSLIELSLFQLKTKLKRMLRWRGSVCWVYHQCLSQIQIRHCGI